MDFSKLCPNCFYDNKTEKICPQCGYKDGDKAANELHLPPGTILRGQYMVGKVLGCGGFGVTYLAYDLNLNVLRAVKEYLPGALATRSTDGVTVYAFSGTAEQNYRYSLDKFVEEGRMLARFHDIETIVSVFDYFKENNTAYLVMEHLEGKELSAHIADSGGSLTLKETLDIVKPVIGALREVHANGLIHRDVSPDNIFIKKSGRIKLLDFGATRFAISEKSKSISVILKPGYAPPEQYYSRGRQGPWTDIYALAATMVKMMTGQAPPEAMERMADTDAADVTQLARISDGHVRAVLTKALSLKGEKRYADMAAFERVLYEQKEETSSSAEKADKQAKSKSVRSGIPNVAAVNEDSVLDKKSLEIGEMESTPEDSSDYILFNSSKKKKTFKLWIYILTVFILIGFFFIGPGLWMWRPGIMMFLAIPFAFFMNYIANKIGVSGVILGLVAVLALLAFLFLGFWFNYWYIAWVVFLVIPTIALILKVIKSNKNENIENKDL